MGTERRDDKAGKKRDNKAGTGGQDNNKAGNPG